MKSFLLSALFLAAGAAGAQRSTWDVHPLNMVPCQEWIYPEPGCGGCSSCRSATDEDPQLMDGTLLQWSPELVMCPHPVDTLGNNAVIISNWPISPSQSAYIYGRMEFHSAMRIDTLELTCAAWSPGIDSVEIAIQFNETDPLSTITLLHEPLSGAYQHYTITDIGEVPVSEFGPSYANFYVRTHGTDVWLLFREMRVVASVEQTSSIHEAEEGAIFIVPCEGGANISARRSVPYSVLDASGRTTCAGHTAGATSFVPLSSGLNIVRAGSQVKRIVR